MDPAADEALSIYIDALLAVGGRDAEARGLASAKDADSILARRDQRPGLGKGWWALSGNSCTRAQLGRPEAALTLLELIPRSQGLAVSPLLQDALCFRPFAGNPRYQAVLEQLEARQAALRTRLPATLRKHGVADVRAGSRANAVVTQ
jgi:hypothetical protein